MSRKAILHFLEHIRHGEIKHKPYDWLASGNDWIHCPVDGKALAWSYSAGDSELDEYEVYQCPECKREWNSHQLSAVDDAWKVYEGKDPYQGAIFQSESDDGDVTYYTRKWDDEEQS